MRARSPRRRSAASSTAARRLEQAVFYLDESIYSRILADRIKAAGPAVRTAADTFKPGISDEVWLAECGSNGWIVLMRDHQPTGGYPRIATVLDRELDRLTQMRPGTTVRFLPVTLAHAHRLTR